MSCGFLFEPLKFPAHVAIVDTERNVSITYGDLDVKVDAISRTIKKIDGCGPFVSIMTKRSVGSVVAMLGVLKAGGAYIPVDPSFPIDRQNYMIEHAGSKQIIVDSENLMTVKMMKVPFVQMLIVDGEGTIVDVVSFDVPADLSSDNALAYVLYTSGSTGKPKGVKVLNSSLVNAVKYFCDKLELTEDDNILGLTTFSFDISMLEIFMALSSGAKLVLVSSSAQKIPLKIMDILLTHEISIMQATPTTYEMLLACGWRGSKSIKFLVGGEAFRPSLAPLARNCRALYNVYGPTETTIWSSCFTVAEGGQCCAGVDLNAAMPIGAPIYGTTFHVVSSAFTEVEDGTEGELCIGGDGVAEGYLHSPDLTAAKFSDNPFGAGRLYRTGDQVKKLGDGNYVFVGRIDDQVKVRGFRIELGEVEGVVSCYPAISQAVVVVSNSFGNQQLVAMVKLRGDHESHESATGQLNAAVLVFCRERLPYYMVPQRIVHVDSYPTTPNGKLDRRALAATLDLQENSLSTTSTATKQSSTAEAPSTTTTSATITGGCNAVSGAVGTASTGRRGDGTTQSLATYIRKLVYEINGARVSEGSTFLSVAIDSLAAVAFVSLISTSLGGAAIDMNDLYSPSTTIASFSVSLFRSLNESNNAVLVSLGIDRAVDGNSMQTHHTNDVIDRQGGEDASSRHRTTAEGGNIYDDASVALLEKRTLLDLLRGFLIIMVTWDHFFVIPDRDGTRIRADTAMFLIMSGFTVMVQSLVSGEGETGQREPEMSGGGAGATSGGRYASVPSQDIAQQENEILASARAFDWKHFLLVRAMSLFPFYWMVMVLDMPRVFLCYNEPNMFGEVMQFSTKEAITLALVYLPALQLWTDYGYLMLDLYYVSILWGCFLVYALLRSVISWPGVSRVAKGLAVVSIIALLITQHKNIHDLNAGFGPCEGFTYFALGGAVACWFCYYLGKSDQDDAGAGGGPRSLSPSLHHNGDDRHPSPTSLARNSQGQEQEEEQGQGQVEIPTRGKGPEGESDLEMPLLASDLKPFDSIESDPTSGHPGADASQGGHGNRAGYLLSSSGRSSVSSLPSRRNCLWAICVDVTAFALLFVIFFNNWGLGGRPKLLLDRVIERVVAPALFMVLLMAAMVLKPMPPTRGYCVLGCSCFLSLTSAIPALALLGQCSLSIYIFQGVFVAFYFYVGVAGMEAQEFPYTCTFVNHHWQVYALEHPLWLKLIGVTGSVVLSIAIQKLVVDKVIAAWHARFISQNRTRPPSAPILFESDGEDGL